jgi:hypothetical protein
VELFDSSNLNPKSTKPQELFFGGLVDPVTKVLFRFTFLPKKPFRFTPCTVCPAKIMNLFNFRL